MRWKPPGGFGKRSEEATGQKTASDQIAEISGEGEIDPHTVQAGAVATAAGDRPNETPPTRG